MFLAGKIVGLNTLSEIVRYSKLLSSKFQYSIIHSLFALSHSIVCLETLLSGIIFERHVVSILIGLWSDKFAPSRVTKTLQFVRLSLTMK